MQTLSVCSPDSQPGICHAKTLSVDETAGIISVLKRRFPLIQGPRKEDICYATTNRQMAVRDIAPQCDAMLVIGAPNSSGHSVLWMLPGVLDVLELSVQQADDIDWGALGSVRRMGITAGASTPGSLVQDVITACRERFEVTLEHFFCQRECDVPLPLVEPSEKSEGNQGSSLRVSAQDAVVSPS